jgi:NFACT protein C-terminal domain
LDLSLKEFIASPKAGDILSDAVPICAPWSALSRCKYKVKLIPGAVKKGKAARSIIGGFLSLPVDNVGEDPEKMSGREKELLESLKGNRLHPLSSSLGFPSEGFSRILRVIIKN